MSFPRAHIPAVGGIHLELVADWAPSVAPGLGRLWCLVKLAPGVVVADRSAIEIRLLGASGDLVEARALPVVGMRAGPSWCETSTGLLAVHEGVRWAEAAFRDAVSDRVARSDVDMAVLLRVASVDFGLSGEPLVWWSFRNLTGASIAVGDILGSVVLSVDGEAQHPRVGAYNGPALLAPRRAITQWWTREDVSLSWGSQSRTLAVEVLGARSEPACGPRAVQ